MRPLALWFRLARKYQSRRKSTGRATSWPQLELLEDRLTPSTLIQVTDRRDLIFDATRNELLITTTSGKIQRYDIASNTLLTPFTVGTTLNGADITTDGTSLYVAESQTNATQGVLHKVRLSDGQVTDLTYTRSGGETGSWDVVLLNNGLGLVVTQFNGSGAMPLLRQLNLATDVLTTRTDLTVSGGSQNGPNTRMQRSSDRSVVYLTEPGSTGLAFTYDASANAFSSKTPTNLNLTDVPRALSRDGTLIAQSQFGSRAGIGLMNRSFQTVQSLDVSHGGDTFSLFGGMAFDPLHDVLYVAQGGLNQIVAYDTNTWAEKYRLSVEENLNQFSSEFDDGTMEISPNGQLLFLSTAAGVRMFNLPNSNGTPTTLRVSGFPAYDAVGIDGSVLVASRDPAGNIVSGYTGTVHFTSSDPAAVLPADYTFNQGDQGVHTFSVTLSTSGTRTITVTDIATSTITGSQTGIVVHAAANSLLIPVAKSRDLVYDATRNLLYVTTFLGTLERYDPIRQQSLVPLAVGARLNGADVTVDGNFLYTAEDQRGPTSGFIRKVDLATGASSVLTYSRTWASWDVALTGTTPGFVDLQYEGSGIVPLLQINLTNDAFSVRARPNPGGNTNIQQNTLVHRNADRSAFFFTESNNSGGPIFAYDATTDSFSPKPQNSNQDNGNRLSAVNRTGTLIAQQVGSRVAIVDTNFNPVQALAPTSLGMIFDPILDVLYLASRDTNQIIAYDTSTWAEKFRLDVGENLLNVSMTAFGSGVMAISPDGKFLFLATPSGIRAFTLPTPTGTAASLLVTDFPTFVGTGIAGTVKIVARDPAGNVATGYTGTVHFSSTDAGAGLPADYTFSPGDQGVHTFQVTLNTVATQSLTVKDVAAPAITGTQANITVHSAGPVALIPVTTRRDLVYDPTRGLLYITTSDGKIERYDPVGQSLLAPLRFGASLEGADITEDGASLYVAEDQRAALNGFFRKVNLVTGTATLDPYNYTAGAYDVAIGAGGKALATIQIEGSGSNSLYRFDVGTEAFTTAASVPAKSLLARGPDRSLIVLAEAGYSNLIAFDPTNNSLTPEVGAGNTLSRPIPAVNRDGSLVAMDVFGVVKIYNRSLGFVQNLTGTTGGTLFDPLQDLLYVASGTTIKAFNTNTFVQQFQIPIGEDIGTGSSGPVAMDEGVMAVSSDGKLLFLSTPSGIRVFQLPSARVGLSTLPVNVTAGSSQSITVTAMNSSGSTLTSFRGTVHFTSTDPQAVLPADYTFTVQDQGVHTFSITLRTVGPQSVSVTSAGLTSGQVNVTVDSASADHLQLALPASAAAGSVFSATVKALDPFGNVATGFRGSVHFASTDSQAVLPADYTFTSQDQGVHSFSVTLKTAGSKSVTVTSNGLTMAQMNVDINPIAADHLQLTLPSIATAGTAFNAMVKAVDPFGNVAISFVGTVHFTSADGQAVLPADYSFVTQDQGVHTFSLTLRTSGLQNVTVASTGVTSGLSSVSVSAVAADHLQLMLPATAMAGVAFNATLKALDPFSNVAPTFGGTVHFATTAPFSTLPPDYTFTVQDQGSHTFSMTLTRTGAKNITVTSTGLTMDQPSILVIAADASHFQITSLPTSALAGTALNPTLIALDPFENVATGFRGTMHFASNDGLASVPADYTFTANDNGQHAFTGGVTLRTAGPGTLTATDAAKPEQMASASVTVTPAAAHHLTFGQQPTSQKTNTSLTPAITVRIVDAFENLLVSDSRTITLMIGTNPSGGTLSGTTNSAAAGGITSFADLRIDKPGTAYTLTASATGVTAAGSTAFNITSVTIRPQAELFVLGFNNQVYAQKLDANGQPASDYFPTQTSAVKAFTVGHDVSGRSLLFVIGGDNQVYAMKFDANGLPASPYQLTRPGFVQSIAAGNDAQGRPELFAVGLNEPFVFGQKFDDNGNSISAYFLTQGSGVKALSVGHDASGRPETFVIGGDNQVYAMKFDAQGNPASPYFLTQPGFVKSIAATNDASGRPVLFALGLSQAFVFGLNFDAQGIPAGPYFLTQGSAVKDFTLAQDGTGKPQLFVTGLDSQIYTMKLDSAARPASPYLSTQPGSVKALTATSDSQGRLVLFVVGGDDQVYEQLFDTAGNVRSPYFLTKPGRVLGLRVTQ